jgi:hypothetical protein
MLKPVGAERVAAFVAIAAMLLVGLLASCVTTRLASNTANPELSLTTSVRGLVRSDRHLAGVVYEPSI